MGSKSNRKNFKGNVYIRNSGIEIIDEESAIGIDSAASFRRRPENNQTDQLFAFIESAVVDEESKHASPLDRSE